MSWARLLGLIVVALFLVSAFTPLPNRLSRWVARPARVERAQAIVVLGASIWPDDVLTNPSLRRAVHGITLHRKGLAPLVVFLGPARGKGSPEAEVRAELARELGISPQVILTEAEVWTTRDEAVRTAALLQPRGVTHILLITNSQHMMRARRAFERVGFAVLPAPADAFSHAADAPEARLDLMRRVLAELLARLSYWVAGYI
ncbi:MAG: YdcF family protein [Alphaproteobacteria bacterium]